MPPSLSGGPFPPSSALQALFFDKGAHRAARCYLPHSNSTFCTTTHSAWNGTGCLYDCGICGFPEAPAWGVDYCEMPVWLTSAESTARSLYLWAILPAGLCCCSGFIPSQMWGRQGFVCPCGRVKQRHMVALAGVAFAMVGIAQTIESRVSQGPPHAVVQASWSATRRATSGSCG